MTTDSHLSTILAFAPLLGWRVHGRGVVHPTATVHPNATIGAWSSVRHGVLLGARVRLGAGVRLGDGVWLGDGVRLSSVNIGRWVMAPSITKDAVLIRVGCQTHIPSEWADHADDLARAHGVSLREVEQIRILMPALVAATSAALAGDES